MNFCDIWTIIHFENVYLFSFLYCRYDMNSKYTTVDNSDLFYRFITILKNAYMIVMICTQRNSFAAWNSKQQSMVLVS